MNKSKGKDLVIHHSDFFYIDGMKTFYAHEYNMVSNFQKDRVVCVKGKRETRLFIRKEQRILSGDWNDHRANLIYESECGIYKLQIGIATPLDLKTKEDLIAEEK